MLPDKKSRQGTLETGNRSLTTKSSLVVSLSSNPGTEKAGTDNKCEIRFPSRDDILPVHFELSFDGHSRRIQRAAADAHLLVNSQPIGNSYPLAEGDLISVGKRLNLVYSPGQLQQVSAYQGLSIHDLSVQLGRRDVLRHLSIQLAPGEMTVVAGPSGCGKSTLLQAILGEVLTSQGFISTADTGPIAFVPQDSLSYPYLTVAENLNHAADLRLSYLSQEQRKHRVSEVLQLLNLVREANHRTGGEDSSFRAEISGGQRKRLDAGFELISEPGVLLMDEPTSGLDPKSQMTFLRRVRDYAKRKRIAVLCVSHAADTFSQFDQAVILRRLDPEVPDDSSIAYIGSAQMDHILAGSGLSSVEELFDPSIRPKETKIVCEDLSIEDSKTIPPSHEGPSARFSVQFLSVLRRSFTWLLRDRMNLLVTALLPVFLGLIVGIALKHILDWGPSAEEGVADIGLLFATLFGCVASLWMGMAIAIRQIVDEGPQIRRDFSSGLDLLTYFLGKIVYVASLCALLTAVFILLLRFFLADGIPGWSGFLSFFWIAFSGGMIGLAISAACHSRTAAMTLMPYVLVPFLLFSATTVRPYFLFEDQPYRPIGSFYRDTQSEGKLDKNVEFRVFHSYGTIALITRPAISLFYLLNERSEQIEEEAQEDTVENPISRSEIAAEIVYFIIVGILYFLIAFFSFVVFGPKPYRFPKVRRSKIARST